jgi:hypothetical protein
VSGFVSAASGVVEGAMRSICPLISEVVRQRHA